jgi:hypothetical protein
MVAATAYDIRLVQRRRNLAGLQPSRWHSAPNRFRRDLTHGAARLFLWSRHVVQTAFYDHAFGRRAPIVRSTYGGWNDLRRRGIAFFFFFFFFFFRISIQAMPITTCAAQIDALKVRPQQRGF